MSGVAVVLDRRGNDVGRECLEKVSFALLPYGRQRRDVWREAAVGFAHTGFVNAPEAILERQPVTGADGNLLLLFDGRLDNREDLTRSLHIANVEAQEASDSRLALLSWERWGAEAPLHWVGEFAVLVWDARVATLTAVVDPLGQRQLVYALTPDMAVVASTARAIFVTGLMEPSIDMQALADHLGLVLPEPDSSFYHGIRRLPAGHMMTISAGKSQISRYYRLTPGEPILLRDDEEYVDATLELLERVVKAQTRAVGTVGTDLSGGLDSTLVAAQAARLVPGSKPIPAFTVQPVAGDTLDRSSPGMEPDEAERVRDVLTHLPRLDSVPVASRGGTWDRIAETTFELAELPAGGAYYEETYARKMETARDLGVTTLLTGHPGNLTLSWYGRGLFGEYFRSLRWFRLIRELYLDKDETKGFGRRAYDYVLRPMLPRAVTGLVKRATQGALWESPWRRFSVIAPQFAAQYNIEARARASLVPYDGGPGLLSATDRADILTQMAHTHDAAGQQMARAAFGIEIRSPLWDQRIIEWSLRVPETQYRRNGVDRWLARRMAARTLPASVAWNRKRGYQDASWHSRIGAELPRLREQIRTLAEDQETAAMIDTGRIEAILANWDSFHPDRISRHQRLLLAAGLQSAVHAGRFVRWVRGANC